jgi:predicted MFS family arabinose efflux permease
MRQVLTLLPGMVALGLDAYVVAGVLPQISASLHQPVPAVGQLVTVFTLSYALLSPIAATLVTGKPMRVVLLSALAVFTVGNALSAVATSLAFLLLSRVIAGFGAGLYSPMSAATAAALVPPERRGRALALITIGLSSGTVAGVPLGLLLASHAGWRGTFWLVTALGVVAMIGVAVSLPAIPPAAPPSLRARLGVLADRHVLSIVLVTVFSTLTSLGTYTYIAPILNRDNVTLYLVIWGLGGLAGNLLVGAVIDRWRDTRALMGVLLTVMGASLALLPVGPPALLVFLWGASAWSCPATQQHRVMAARPLEGPVAVSLNASAIYLGSSLGAGLGGMVLAGGGAPAWLAYGFGGLAVCAAVLNQLITAKVPAAQQV